MPKLLVHIACTSLRVSSRKDWYFDNRFFRYMTSGRNNLKYIKPYFNNYVTFYDGTKGEFIGKGQLDNLGFPCLNDV